MGRRLFVTVAPLVMATYVPLCAPNVHPTRPTAAEPMSALWQQPHDLQDRDLYEGPWGHDLAPDPDATYTFLRLKTTGVNPGVVVLDPEGQEWHVKQPPHDGRDAEGPVEVVLSRVLSAVGYHQPPVYFLRSFTLRDGAKTRTEPGGRFRLDMKTLKSAGTWSWQKNPFVGSRPYQGLLVILLMLNSSDLKNGNNTLYEAQTPDRGVERWFVGRDLGTALGNTDRLAPRRGNPDEFERHGFINGVKNGFVQFEYHGWHQELLRDRITPQDVGWACDLLSGLTDLQWRDAFRAGAYDAAVADRFIARLHAKIADGRRISEGAPGR